MSHARKLLAAVLSAALVSLAVAGTALAADGATIAQVSAGKRAPLAAKLAACSTVNGARSATFKGTMPAVPAWATGRMEMRFELFQRSAPKAPWTQLAGVDSFDEWDISDPGVSGFIVTKKLTSLAPGSAYRARISYRWRDAAGKVRRLKKKVTGSCTQPGTLPDLTLESPLITLAGRADAVLYKVTVRNVGLGGTGIPFAVSLNVNGTTQPPQIVGPLAAGAHTEVAFTAPRCQPGTAVIFTADAQSQVAEGNEQGNVLQRTCRAAQGT